MNLLLLDQIDLVSSTQARITGRRAEHVVSVLRTQVGDSIRVGLINDKMGTGLITKIQDGKIDLEINLQDPPPPKLPLHLFLALPRPKFLARCLQTATSLGVKEITLMNSFRVDKVYWSCQQITPDEIRAACLLGLEQARDTVLPVVTLRPLFKPFVEDEVPSLIRDTKAYVAHPPAKIVCPRGLTESASLVIGPEGGFIDYEIEKLEGAGFTPVSLSPRILKVETAIATLLGRLF